MVTDACTLFATLIDTEVRAWSAVESVLSGARNVPALDRLLVLRTVRDTPACRIQGAAASQGIVLGMASRLVNRLHRDGLPHRIPYEHDRCAITLTVTEQGLAYLEEACAVVEKEQECLLAPLSTVQRKELARCLALIVEAAKEYT